MHCCTQAIRVSRQMDTEARASADLPGRQPRRTQAERRAATRGALLDATIEVLVDSGYAGLTTSGAESDDGSTAGADIQTIAVTRDHWGTGLGSRLLTELLRAATAFECAEVLLECRVDNVRAQKLYERFGFETIGVRRGYYQPGNVDALVMRLTDPSTSVNPASPVDGNGVQGTETNG